MRMIQTPCVTNRIGNSFILPKNFNATVQKKEKKEEKKKKKKKKKGL